MIKDLLIFQLPKFADDRGEFLRFFDDRKMFLENKKIKQVNISKNPFKYTLRGLHYQVGKESEHKIMYLNHGSIFLVVVDLRKSSKSYLEKFEITLNCEDNKTIFIPAGCATGWLSLKKYTEIVYLMYDRFEDCIYSGLRYDDPTLKIWPSKPKVISEKDLSWKFI